MAPPPVQHRYFVSFAHARGFGCSEISLTKPIRSITDIQGVSDLLKPQAVGTPIVMYFALLGTSESAQPGTNAE